MYPTRGVKLPIIKYATNTTIYHQDNENLVYMYKYKDENPSTISTQRVQANVNMRGKPKL
jgi:hypothetical protein